MIKSSVDEWKERVLDSLFCTEPARVRWHTSPYGVISAFQEMCSWNSIFLGAYNTRQSRDWDAGEGWTHDDHMDWYKPEDKKPWREKTGSNFVDLEKGYAPPWLETVETENAKTLTS